MTLAPRSCPSNPGFATRTRILRSSLIRSSSREVRDPRHAGTDLVVRRRPLPRLSYTGPRPARQWQSQHGRFDVLPPGVPEDPHDLPDGRVYPHRIEDPGHQEVPPPRVIPRCGDPEGIESRRDAAGVPMRLHAVEFLSLPPGGLFLVALHKSNP